MRDFDARLLRLKQALGVVGDQEVAAALGMTKAAFSDRKKRGSFPEDRLRAAVQQNPAWKLDVDFILTGTSQREAKFSSGIEALKNATQRAQSLPLPDRERILIRDLLWAIDSGNGDLVKTFLDDYRTEFARSIATEKGET